MYHTFLEGAHTLIKKMGACPSLISYTEQQELNKKSQTMEQTNQIITAFTVRLEDIQSGIKKKTDQQLNVMTECKRLGREAHRRKDKIETNFQCKRHKIAERTRKLLFDRLLMLESIKVQLSNNTNHVQLMQWVAGVVKMTMGNQGNVDDQNKILEDLDTTIMGKESVDFFQQQLQQSFTRLSEPSTDSGLYDTEDDDLEKELDQFLNEPDIPAQETPMILPALPPFSPVSRTMVTPSDANNNNDDEDGSSSPLLTTDTSTQSIYGTSTKARNKTKGRQLLADAV